MLSMQDISKVYRTDTVETHALRQFSLDVAEGDFVSVTGPSGSGKTTFLNIAGLLEEFSSGTFELDGRDVSSLNDNERSKLRNEKIGFIFQSFNLIPELDVFDNVDVPLRYRGFDAAERRKRIERVLEIVGLGSRRRRLGGRVRATRDSLHIEPGRLHGAQITTYDDHRMAMSFALAGLRVPDVVIRDPDCVSKTWPEYFSVLEHL